MISQIYLKYKNINIIVTYNNQKQLFKEGNKMNVKHEHTTNEELNKKTPKPIIDLDDFIFKDEEIKYQSER